jgi:hypothetical protein
MTRLLSDLDSSMTARLMARLMLNRSFTGKTCYKDLLLPMLGAVNDYCKRAD